MNDMLSKSTTGISQVSILMDGSLTKAKGSSRHTYAGTDVEPPLTTTKSIEDRDGSQSLEG